MHAPKSALRAEKTWYQWMVAAACFVMVFTCLGFCSSTKGLYLAAITDTLGIKRSLYSFNDTFRYLTLTLLNLFFGTLISKFGSRKMIAAGFLSLIASMLIYSVAESVYVFYIGGVFLGAGLAWTTTTMVGYVVDRWVTKHRGTVMGAVLAANGLGGALAAQIVSPIIYQEGTDFGFRTAYRITALILLVVGIVVILIVRDKPNPSGDTVSAGKKKPKGSSWEGISFEEALKKPYFYGIIVCVFLGGIVLQGTQSATSAHLKDIGFEPAHVATVLSIHSLVLCAMKLLTGFSYDRLGMKVTLSICCTAAVAMILILAVIQPGPAGSILAIVQGVISAVGLPLETIMIPLLASELFGKRDYPKIMGIIGSACSAGCAIGIPTINLFYDLLGEYRPALYALSVIMLVVAAGFMLVLHAAQREKARIEQSSNR